MNYPLYYQAREVQQLAARYLYKEKDVLYTDVQEWTQTQTFLTQSIGELLKQEGDTPNEEGERLVAILMGYTVAVRNRKNIAMTLEKAEQTLPLITDCMTKCRLAVYCYGECLDEELGCLAHRLVEEQKKTQDNEEVMLLEVLLQSFALQL